MSRRPRARRISPSAQISPNIIIAQLNRHYMEHMCTATCKKQNKPFGKRVGRSDSNQSPGSDDHARAQLESIKSTYSSCLFLLSPPVRPPFSLLLFIVSLSPSLRHHPPPVCLFLVVLVFSITTVNTQSNSESFSLACKARAPFLKKKKENSEGETDGCHLFYEERKWNRYPEAGGDAYIDFA